MSVNQTHTRVKICGLTREEDVKAAVAAGANYLGFIVEAASKRRLSVSEAATISAVVHGQVQRVAVTVNADNALLTRIMAEMNPEFVQCHGSESPSRVAEISRKFKVGTIKALGIASESDMKSAEEYVGVCDFILYDAKPPKGTDVQGGHGIAIDWDLIARAPRPKIFALAGGLNADNVAQAITQTQAPIVDVSSGVEASPGIKDPNKINAFMDAAKRVSKNG